MDEPGNRRTGRGAPVVGRRDESGEGVISTAIAVLVVALLGVALWAGFSTIMNDATDRTSEQIQSIDGTP